MAGAVKGADLAGEVTFQAGAKQCGLVLDVITGLVPVIPMRLALSDPKRDGRNKPGHDIEV